MGPIWQTAIWEYIDRHVPPLDDDVARLVEDVVRLVDNETMRRAAVAAKMRQK